MNIDRNKAIADMRAVLSMKAPASGPTYTALVCASVKACIERWAPLGSTYRKNADSIDPFSKHVDFPEQKLRGILTALAFDCENDRVGSFNELVHASVFDDLIEQARYLLDEGYGLPSAVITGATLEEHLRKLADRHSLPLTFTDKNGRARAKSASQLNDDLHKAQAYGQPEWRQNQVWIDVRNDAAHGDPEFAKRTKPELQSMLDGVRAFIMRYPA